MNDLNRISNRNSDYEDRQALDLESASLINHAERSENRMSNRKFE